MDNKLGGEEMKYNDEINNVSIDAGAIDIGTNVVFGKNVFIKVLGEFQIGDYSKIGDNSIIMGNNIKMGKWFYNSDQLRIGGGGRFGPEANFSCGDRAVILNSFINVCKPVTIGDDFNMSEESTILTHGYSLSVLDGYPASFEAVKIGNSVEIGYRSLVLMGVEIVSKCVIGAQSIVTKALTQSGIYVGSPAKYIKPLVPLNYEQRIEILNHILNEYQKIALFHGVTSNIKFNYPYITMKEFTLNVENYKYEGKEDEDTDDLRDYLRKWGIRIYTTRPFKSKISIKI